MKSFVTTVTFQSLLTFTCSECHRVIKKSSSRATSTTCGQSRHMIFTYLPRREKVFVIAAENGNAVAQPNLHQRAPCQAETTPHLVIYPRAQCYKKCQLYARTHKKMELPPNRSREKNLMQPADCWKGLNAHLAQPGSDRGPGYEHAGHAWPNITLTV